MINTENEVAIQRQYYAKTAGQYNAMHVQTNDEHSFALSFLCGMLDYLKVHSVLDIGSGTGRAIFFLKQAKPDLKVVGIEPVKELREIGYSNGLSEDELVDGDATNITFLDGSFDLVCEFGALHHIKRADRAVSEMLRIAKKAIFISDANNFGQGTLLARTAKQLLDIVGLWKIADLIKTKGKGYTISDGDGLAYSYSVFNDYRRIEEQCKSMHVVNTTNGHINYYRTASTIALLGIKKQIGSL